MPTRRQEPGKLIQLDGPFLSLVVALILLTAAGCSSVSLCLESEKGVSASEGISASEDASRQGCTANRPTR